MRKALTLALLLGLVAEMSGAASFRATLRGDRETPSAGDPNGWGFAAAILDGGTLRYYLLTHGIAAPSVASIHAGRPGKSGSAVVTLATSFGTVGSDTFASAGSVPVEAGLAQALAADPTAYYFTVDNADFPSGALRGQLAGDGGGGPTRVAELIGRREVPPGDPDGAGFAAATVIGDTVHCFFWGKGIGSPTAAHIQRGAPGVAGPVVVDCQPAFADGMGVGSATVDSSLASELLTNPAMFYFNLHTAEFAGGALRGQLADAETSVFFPVVSGTSGVGGTLWRTDIRILNPGDMEAMVRGELYPANSTGLQSPSKSVIISVAPGGQAALNQVVQDIFQASGNGAMRLISNEPIAAVARIYNDQRANPAIGGTLGQFAPGQRPDAALDSGALPLLSNRPAAEQSGYRTNVGYFNPWPESIEVTFAGKKPDGSSLGATTLTLPPYANKVESVFSVISSVPADQRTQEDFFVTFTARKGVFVFASVVDNKTSDAINVVSVKFPPPTPIPTPNATPTPTIPAPTATPTSVIIGPTPTATPTATGVPPTATPTATPAPPTATATGVPPTATMTATVIPPTATPTATAIPPTPTRTATPVPPTPTPTQSPAAVTLASLQGSIFTPKCTSCHGSGGDAGMDLRAGQAYSNLVNVNATTYPGLLRVKPFDAANSALHQKLASGHRSSSVSATDRANIDSWILAGALNN